MKEIVSKQFMTEGNFTYKIEEFTDGTVQKVLVETAKTVIGADYTEYTVGDTVHISIIVASENPEEITNAILVIDDREYSISLSPSDFCENCKSGQFEFVADKEEYEVIINCADAKPLILNLKVS